MWWLGSVCFHLGIFKWRKMSLVAQTIKRLPTMRETWVQSLGWEDLSEKEMATHSNILVWKIPRIEEPGRLQSMGSQRVRHDWVTSLTHSLLWLCTINRKLKPGWRHTCLQHSLLRFSAHCWDLLFIIKDSFKFSTAHWQCTWSFRSSDGDI